MSKKKLENCWWSFSCDWDDAVPKAIFCKDLCDKHLDFHSKNAVHTTLPKVYFCPTKDLTLKNSWGNRPDKIHPKKPKQAQATLHPRLRWLSCLVLPELTNWGFATWVKIWCLWYYPYNWYHWSITDPLCIALYCTLLWHFGHWKLRIDHVQWEHQRCDFALSKRGLQPQLSVAWLAFVACKVSSSASSFCLSFCNSCPSAGVKTVEYNCG